MERANLEQELGQQAKIVRDLQQPDDEFEDNARNEGQKLCRFIEITRVGGLLDACDLFVHLAVDIFDRVGGGEVELHGALGSVCRHVLFDHHAELDIVAAAVDLLAG